MQVMDRNHIRLRVFERGSGETLSCGTGRLRRSGRRHPSRPAGQPGACHHRGGLLTIAWNGEGTSC